MGLPDAIEIKVFFSYSYNSTLGWEKNDCIWCVQDDKCYSPLEKGKSYCYHDILLSYILLCLHSTG